MNRFAKWAWIMLYATSSVATSAQTLTTLAILHSRNGHDPEAALMQGSDGDFYGTLATGGVDPGGGSIFKITPAGKLTTLHRFCAEPKCTDGAEPYSGLIEASDGNFYGTTLAGGTGGCNAGIVPGCGTVFRITPQGKLTTLYSICTRKQCLDGAEPFGSLVQGADGRFYGTTCLGGEYGGGTVFAISVLGKFRRLHSFNIADGGCPAARDALVQDLDGNLYGTTAVGGANNWGTVFKITLHGRLTTLHSFCSPRSHCADGGTPNTGLTRTSNGSFYGVIAAGGIYGGGTIFRISRSGGFKTVYSFCSLPPDCLDGNRPIGRLAQASDGNLYGTTISGGSAGSGTIFKMTLSGSLTTLHSFCVLCGEGGYPWSGLSQSSDGRFYGTTTVGWERGSSGTVFILDASPGDW